MSFIPASAAPYNTAFNGTAYATAANLCPCAPANGNNGTAAPVNTQVFLTPGNAANNVQTVNGVRYTTGAPMLPANAVAVNTVAAAPPPAATVVNSCTGETRTYQAPQALPPAVTGTVCQTVTVQPARAQYDDRRRDRKERNACKRIIQQCPAQVTACYTPCPRRCDCYPADPKEYELLHLDAFENDIDLGTCEDNLYNYFTDGCSFIANDGRVQVTSNGLALIARTYTKTVPQCPAVPPASSTGQPAPCDAADPQVPPECKGPTTGAEGIMDHYKTLICHNGTLEVPTCGELYVEALATGMQNNAEASRLSGLFKVNDVQFVEQPRRDPRIASFVPIMMTDMHSGTWLSLSWRFTDAGAFAFHEIWPFGRAESFAGTNSTFTAAFTAAYLVTTRNACRPMDDWARVGIGLDVSRGVAHYYYNGTRVLTVPRIGHRPAPQNMLSDYGGEARDIAPRCMTLCFGHMTHMDGVSPAKSAEHRDVEVGLVELAPITVTGQKNSYEVDDALGASQMRYVYSPAASIAGAADRNKQCSTPWVRLAAGAGSTGIIREVKAAKRC